MNNARPKPSFETLISLARTNGMWSKESAQTLKDFFIDSNIKDSVIDSLLSQAKSDGSSADPVCIHFTLIALFILKEAFDTKKEEW